MPSNDSDKTLRALEEKPSRMAMLHDPRKISAQEEPQELPLVPAFDTNELVNAVTHGIGLVLSIVGAIALIVRSYSHGDAYLVAGCTVFSITLIAVYAASTLSHIPCGPRLTHFCLGNWTRGRSTC